MTAHESAIYQGSVYHERFYPTRHKFSYDIYLFWLKLSELPDLEKEIKHFSFSRRGLVRFNRDDYFGNNDIPLETSIREKMSSLHGEQLSGDVFFMGQVRMFGLYFSPVNFYFLRNDSGEFSHMLAEVSNTPWNERHYYLVDMAKQEDTPKAFHVSPFNPMDMQYKWTILAPGDNFSMSMSCHQDKKHFTAGLNMKRMSFNTQNLRYALKRIPSMTVKTVVGIYWQALKLFIKRTPVYDHP